MSSIGGCLRSGNGRTLMTANNGNGSRLSQMSRDLSQYAHHGQPVDEETTRMVAEVITELVQGVEAQEAQLRHATSKIEQLDEVQRRLRLRVYGDGELDVPGMREINLAVRGVGTRVQAVEESVEMMRKQLWLAMALLVGLAAGVPVVLIVFYAWWF